MEKIYVLYDRQCKLCLASVKRLKELHTSAELRFVSVQSYLDGTGEEIPDFGSVDREKLLAKLHVVDEAGRAYAGADGVVRIIRTARGLSWLAVLYKIPGMSRLADALYRYVANRRYDWFGKTDEGCENGVCSLPAHHQEDGGKNG
ncbi:thiol-disulfide oxidoreductase DCC family protein [Paenibacillus spongiae]|uniref:DUF393 domain-containing protein n=1 Tax=Paenibacillus spongiae TaxID=2909671 RepID=A0ABY5S5T1_9BACL|nr:DUF393 domain-containing protein [Paenibacillus spongiae]UVI28098.1 DUF393 domain-containing protein [Paenibacillus spongiae]